MNMSLSPNVIKILVTVFPNSNLKLKYFQFSTMSDKQKKQISFTLQKLEPPFVQDFGSSIVYFIWTLSVKLLNVSVILTTFCF